MHMRVMHALRSAMPSILHIETQIMHDNSVTCIHFEFALGFLL